MLFLPLLIAFSGITHSTSNEDASFQAKAYLISEVDPTDGEAYRQYLTEVLPVMESFGGRPLVFAGRNAVPEGAEIQGRLAVVEFPNYDQLQAFWNSTEYQEIKPLREENAVSRIIMAEGLEP